MADSDAIEPRQPSRTLVHASAQFQGPLPPPEMLARYNDVAPNAADRIIAMAESQTGHRQALEASVVNGNVRAQSLGQTYAFILGLVAIAGGIYLMAHDKSVQGLTSIIVAFTALAGVFIYGRVEQARERKRKREELAEASSQRRLPGI